MRPSRFRQCMSLLVCVAAIVVGGCAGNIPAAPTDQRAATDPWEPLNRRISNFNDGFDKVTFKPLAKGYEKVVPRFARRGVGNFSTNLRGPLHIINNLLQGKGGRATVEFGRFLTNTIFGLGGLFDVASSSGLESYPESFGETFAVWGVPDGPYFVIPILGPSTVSGAAAMPFNFLADPLWHAEDNSTKWIVYGIRAVDLRQRLFAAEALVADSYDRYLTIREW